MTKPPQFQVGETVALFVGHSFQRNVVIEKIYKNGRIVVEKQQYALSYGQPDRAHRCGDRYGYHPRSIRKITPELLAGITREERRAKFISLRRQFCDAIVGSPTAADIDTLRVLINRTVVL